MNETACWVSDMCRRSTVIGVALLLLTAFASGLAAETQAEKAEPIDPDDIPSVHNTFYQVPEGTVSWDVLGTMDIEVEVIAPLQTQMTKSFTDEVKALDDQDRSDHGLPLPAKGRRHTRAFSPDRLATELPLLPACRAEPDG